MPSNPANKFGVKSGMVMMTKRKIAVAVGVVIAIAVLLSTDLLGMAL